jgi:UDP-glucose 6-dehydrogenase
MKVVIVGQGYVGLPLAMAICSAGHEESRVGRGRELTGKIGGFSTLWR